MFISISYRIVQLIYRTDNYPLYPNNHFVKEVVNSIPRNWSVYYLPSYVLQSPERKCGNGNKPYMQTECRTLSMSYNMGRLPNFSDKPRLHKSVALYNHLGDASSVD